LMRRLPSRTWSANIFVYSSFIHLQRSPSAPRFWGLVLGCVVRPGGSLAEHFPVASFALSFLHHLLGLIERSDVASFALSSDGPVCSLALSSDRPAWYMLRRLTTIVGIRPAVASREGAVGPRGRPHAMATLELPLTHLASLSSLKVEHAELKT
jgi:hypothetical protein